jgi:hypothetical protein
MDDASSDKIGNLERRVTGAREAVSERVMNATGVAAAAAGQAKKLLGEAGESAQQAWSQAGGVTEDVVDAGRRATRSVSRKIHENPLLTVLAGVALGYAAGLWTRGGAVGQEGSPRPTRKPKRLRHKPAIKDGSAAATNHPPL